MRIILLILLCLGFAAQAKAPYVDPKTDAEHFGDPQTLLFWTGESKVVGFRNIDQLMPTLRDYARIGLFAMQGGVLLDGTEVLAQNWMKQSTSRSSLTQRKAW